MGVKTLNLKEFFTAMENVRVNVDNKHTIRRGTETLYPVYIILYAHDSLVGKSIRRLTNQPYSHASVSFDTSMNNIFTFGNRYIYNEDKEIYYRKFGAGRESFKKIDGKWSYPPKTPYVIYCLWLPKENIDRMKKRIHEIYNKPDAYRFSYDGLVKFYLNMSSESTNKMFCSQFVASLLAYGGMDLDKLPSLYSPYQLKDIKDVRYVESGLLKDFNKAALDKKMNLVMAEYLEENTTGTA